MLLSFFLRGVYADTSANYVGSEMRHEGGYISHVPEVAGIYRAADLKTGFSGKDHAAVISHSFTDQFLEFLRQRQLAVEAANQIAAEGDEDSDEDWEEESYGDRTEGDVTVLHDRGGERQW